MIHGDWIGRWGRACPDREALVDSITGRRRTYGELAADINRLANFLSDNLEVKKGDRVCCLSFNRAEYIILFFALSRLGAILVPLNFRLALDEFMYYLKDAGPAAFFFDREHQPIVEQLKAKMVTGHTVCFDDNDDAGISLPSLWENLSTKPPVEVNIGEEDPQLIIYTSGTTGQPKGVILTHGMIEANSVNTNLGWDLCASDRTILHAAMFYTAGWNVFTLPLFQCSATNVLIQGFEPDLVLDLIEKEKITIFFGVPTMYQMMLDSPRFDSVDFSSVRFLVSGGAPLGGHIFEAYKQRKGAHIWEGYGLTEVGPNNFMANGKPGTIGHAMPGVDVKLVDIDGVEVKKGEEGEILLRGRHMLAGYWNKPEETAKAVKDGWFHTGDLGRMDEDGHYSISGRLKDMIISGGANIYPAEIEQVIAGHPDVLGAAVIGVPDPKWGEVCKAVVELRGGASLTFEELKEFLAGRLGKFKQPKYMTVIDELPRTPASGKIQKFLLKKLHGQADNN